MAALEISLIASLIAATVLNGLVAGFVFAFAVVVMPGLGTLPDRDFLRAFKRVDGVIQDNQPLFILVWVGSAAVVEQCRIYRACQTLLVEPGASGARRQYCQRRPQRCTGKTYEVTVPAVPKLLQPAKEGALDALCD